MQEIEAFLEFLQDRQIGSVTAMYGWACEIDEPYIPITVPDAREFFRQAVSEKIWEPGSADLYVEVPTLTAEFLFCHESDIHLISKNDKVLAQWRTRWLTQGYTVDENEGQRTSSGNKT